MFAASRTRRTFLAIFCLAAALHADAVVGAEQPLVVETLTGRVFHGLIDERTTDDQLVLRSGSPGLVLWRPIEWRAISKLRYAGRELSPQQLLAVLKAQGWSPPAELIPSPAPSESLAELPPGAEPRPARSPVAARAAYHQPEPPPRVRSLYVEAGVGRWSGGVDNDGILLRVMPLDELNTIVPAGGTLEVDLIGEQGARLHSGQPFPRLARWVQAVQPADFGLYGASYRLPFQAWHPDFDLRLGSQAMVHARLSVPGQGVFDATATMVQIRPFDTSRDRLQKYTGRRFLPLERTNRGTNDSGVFQPPAQ